jgi:hypothetical protein
VKPAARVGGFSGALAMCTLLVGGCADRPPTPDWQLNAKSDLDRAVAAWFDGNDNAEAQAIAAVRAEIARTGRPALLARAELVRCAARVASLVLEPCRAFDALAPDAAPAERAYAAFLAGRAGAADAALLPEPQRPLAAVGATAASDLAALDRMNEPLSKLVGAGVLLQAGRATPEVVRRAVDTASAQGWRRPLLAWLALQRQQAEARGDAAEAARIQRRLDLVAPAALPASVPVRAPGTAPTT